jgi:hypothetical protein
MMEYRMTRQAVEQEWTAVEGAPAREMELHPPAGDEWTLHSFEHGQSQVVAVWVRQKRLHEMSEIYSHSEVNAAAAAHAPIKTVADIPEP